MIYCAPLEMLIAEYLVNEKRSHAHTNSLMPKKPRHLSIYRK